VLHSQLPFFASFKHQLYYVLLLLWLLQTFLKRCLVQPSCATDCALHGQAPAQQLEAAAAAATQGPPPGNSSSSSRVWLTVQVLQQGIVCSPRWATGSLLRHAGLMSRKTGGSSNSVRQTQCDIMFVHVCMHSLHQQLRHCVACALLAEPVHHMPRSEGTCHLLAVCAVCPRMQSSFRDLAGACWAHEPQDRCGRHCSAWVVIFMLSLAIASTPLQCAA
jgi:hypothetical protein